MAWIGGSFSQLSSITDQISSFTKEVLTETTEEVEDPAAELHVARRRVTELEEINEHITTEHDKLKTHCEEISERLETSEYQISAISQEYRKLLQEKEDELKKSRTENDRLRQQHKQLVSGDTASSPLKDLARSGQFFPNGGDFETVDFSAGGDWPEEFHDFNDMVSSQGTINELQSELAKMRVECQHWRDRAEQQNTGNDLLEQENKDLQALLQAERIRHEQELSSRDALHLEQLSSLKAHHQQELQELQNGTDSMWRNKGPQLETEVAGLRETLKNYKRIESELAAVKQLNSQLKEGVDTLNQDKAVLERELAETVSALEQEKASEVRTLGNEKLKLENELKGLQDNISYHQGVISRLQEEHGRSQNEIKQLKDSIETLEGQITHKEAEMQTLRQEQYQRVDKDTRQTQDSTCTEIELTDLREEIKNLKEEAHNLTGTHIKEIESFEARFKAQEMDRHQLSKQLLEKEHTIQDLTAHLGEVKSQLVKKDLSQTSNIEEMMSARDVLTKDLERKQEECAKYSKQLTQLRSHLLEVEERYTQEALRADERETALKQELTLAKENLLSSTNQDSQQNRILREKLVRVQDELTAMVEQRDDALLQMSNAQEQADQNATSLRNLQTVLEQFQRDQSSELAQALKCSQMELTDSHSKCSQLQSQLDAVNHVAEEVGTLRHELTGKNQRIEELQKHLESVSSALEVEKNERLKMSSDNVERVERALVKNLVLGYVHSPDAKKPEVLQLIGKILYFSEEELSQAMGKGHGKGWLWGLWSGSPSQSQQESLSQLFVKFLENESIPNVVPPTTTTTAIPGYVDSRTDPDRPSLATATLIGPPPLGNVQPHPSMSNNSPRLSGQIVPTPSTVPKDQGQSSILNSILIS